MTTECAIAAGEIKRKTLTYKALKIGAMEWCAGGKIDGTPFVYDSGGIIDFNPKNKERIGISEIESFLENKVKFVCAGGTDYPWLEIQDEYGNPQRGGPGDYLILVYCDFKITEADVLSERMFSFLTEKQCDAQARSLAGALQDLF